MSENEERMKKRGEDRVWKAIITRHGGSKKISSTQLGQQIIFSDALRILPNVREWIEVGCAKVYRGELKTYFANDEILLQKITESFLFLVCLTHVDTGLLQSSKKTQTRHRKILSIQNKIMPELSFDQIWRFIEIIIEQSDYFEVERGLEYKNGHPIWNIKYSCTLSYVISHKLALEAYEAFFPEPMLIKPLDWSYDGVELIGGYEYFQFPMIRSNTLDIDYSNYSKKIFDSVNYIQRVPWRINNILVNQVDNDLVPPKKEDYIKATYPNDEESKWNIILSDESLNLLDVEIKEIREARAIFSEQAELYNAEAGDFESAMGKYRAVKLAVGIAKKFMGEDKIYFPHSYDFRGRIYPLPVGLSPQGSDPVKAMLEYHEGEILTKSGEDWCWAYMASLYGDDKIQFEDRIKRGKELLHTAYLEAEEPYQFLAHQLEMRKYELDNTYKVKARIHLDACNSGSQFTSAITGDRAGCIATNVIPSFNEDGSQDRQDAYLLVADKSLGLIKKLISAMDSKEEIEIYEFFKGLFEKDGRKICKTPVMVSNYGGTAGGRSEILWNMLRELGCDRKWITKKNASRLSKIIGDSIQGVLNGGKAFETYIQKMNNVIAKKNKPVIWRTADGFKVIHMKYGELKRKQVKCMLPGSRRPTTINKKIYSNKMSPAKMRSAISPNYIHSLDAELLRKVALRMEDEGINYSDWIHDSFGCHPNYVERMLFITKDEFKSLARRQPLKILDRELRLQADDSKRTQKDLSNIKLPQLKGFDAFNGGLDIVMKSDWFFS